MHAYTEEGNGNLLQYSCLENPRDRGAWWAAVYGVTVGHDWGDLAAAATAASNCSRLLCWSLPPTPSSHPSIVSGGILVWGDTGPWYEQYWQQFCDCNSQGYCWKSSRWQMKGPREYHGSNEPTHFPILSRTTRESVLHPASYTRNNLIPLDWDIFYF